MMTPSHDSLVICATLHPWNKVKSFMDLISLLSFFKSKGFTSLSFEESTQLSDSVYSFLSINAEARMGSRHFLNKGDYLFVSDKTVEIIRAAIGDKFLQMTEDGEYVFLLNGDLFIFRDGQPMEVKDDWY